MEENAAKPYAAAIIEMLDRGAGTTKAFTYPITRIELRNRDSSLFAVFFVGVDGKWEREP